MGTVIIFELKKFVSSKKNFIFIAVLAVFIGIWIALNTTLDTRLNNSKEHIMINEIEGLKGQISINDNTDDEALKKIISKYKNDLKLWEERLTAYQKRDYNEYLRKEIEINEDEIKNKQNGTIIGGHDIHELENENKINKILIDENLKPINENASMEGFNFIRLLGTSSIPIIFMLVMIALTAGTISKEYDRGTWKLLFTQPIPRWKIITGKWISALIINILIITVIPTIYFFVLGTINGFGASNYPVQYLIEGTVQFIPISSFILKEIFMAFITTVFFTTFSLFISRLNKTTAGAVSVSIILSVALYMVSSSDMLKQFNSMNPFSYVNISSVLSGSVQTTVMFPILQFSAVYLIFISAILFAITILLNKFVSS